ncbi:hypothetical protein [Pseudactinotalea terrae]|uniref:hypothetical protein n=1 Tax=Pseudactinotalea terrae TaxID=1743262 RepID=UPI0012E19C16|nr:hypothetical protein [Pseudactinotalea terrae]
MTSTQSRNRQPAGLREGGQFATGAKTEAAVTLAAQVSAVDAKDGPRLRAEFVALREELVGMGGDIRRAAFNHGDEHPTTLALRERAAELNRELNLRRGPLRVAAEQRYTTQAARDAYATCYGEESYADYLEASTLDRVARFPDRAEELTTRTLGEALSSNTSGERGD